MLKEVTEKEFRELVNQGLVLADFFSSTCGPCKMLSFVLADVDKTCGDKATILKVDFDKNKELVEEYEVSGLSDSDSYEGWKRTQASFRSAAKAFDCENVGRADVKN